MVGVLVAVFVEGTVVFVGVLVGVLVGGTGVFVGVLVGVLVGTIIAFSIAANQLGIWMA